MWDYSVHNSNSKTIFPIFAFFIGCGFIVAKLIRHLGKQVTVFSLKIYEASGDLLEWLIIFALQKA